MKINGKDNAWDNPEKEVNIDLCFYFLMTFVSFLCVMRVCVFVSDVFLSVKISSN